MGCNIHTYAETYNTKSKKWIAADKWVKNPAWDPAWDPKDTDSYEKEYEADYHTLCYMPRHYGLYGFLAGVRCDMPGGPIVEPRGAPSDISKMVKYELDVYGEDGHTHSFLTLEELNAHSWDEERIESGYIPLYILLKETDILYHQEKPGKIVPNYWVTDASEREAKVLSVESARKVYEGLLRKHYGISKKDLAIQKALGALPLLKSSMADQSNAYSSYVKYSWIMSDRYLYKDLIKVMQTMAALHKNPNHVRIVFWFDN